MKQLIGLIAIAVFATACGGGGLSPAEGTAAVQTAVAELMSQSQPTVAGETPAPEQPTAEAPADQGVTDGNLVALVNSCIPTNTQQVRARVIDVLNGDSAIVRLNDQTFEVRYIGVDGPEGDEPGAAEALAANVQLVGDKEVLLVMDQTDTDQYGRLVRYVVVENTFVNLELARLGVVFASPEEPDTACDNAIDNAR